MTERRHSVGTSGVRDLLPGIDLAYWWRTDDRRTRLACAAVLRVMSASRWTAADPQHLHPPENFGPAGGGTTIGPYTLMFDETHEVLWVDGQRLASLQGRNVLLLNDAAGSLQVVGTDFIAEDLGGPVPVVFANEASGQLSDQYVQWLASVRDRLSELLQRSPATHAFLSSQTLT
jgi:hypothetical protein